MSRRICRISEARANALAHWSIVSGAKIDGALALSAICNRISAGHPWFCRFLFVRTGGNPGALAIELAPNRIRVNAVLPGLVDTPMLRAGLKLRHLEVSEPQNQIEERRDI